MVRHHRDGGVAAPVGCADSYDDDERFGHMAVVEEPGGAFFDRLTGYLHRPFMYLEGSGGLMSGSCYVVREHTSAGTAAGRQGVD